MVKPFQPFLSKINLNKIINRIGFCKKKSDSIFIKGCWWLLNIILTIILFMLLFRLFGICIFYILDIFVRVFRNIFCFFIRLNLLFFTFVMLFFICDIFHAIKLLFQFFKILNFKLYLIFRAVSDFFLENCILNDDQTF